MLKNMFSNDFLERYKSGQREFSSINLQYADIPVNSLDGIVIRDSRLSFVTFRDCGFKNAKFINCELFYATFYGGSFENALFDNCQIEFTFFENNVFKSTKMLKSRVSWSAIFNAPVGEIDSSTSTFFKFFTNISQITQQDIDDALNLVGPIINKLDISIRAQVKKDLEIDAKKYGLRLNEAETKSTYKNNSSNYKTVHPGYGLNIQNFVDNVIGAYNAAHPQQVKKPYQHDSEYR